MTTNGTASDGGKAPESLRDLHALYHTTMVDVFANGARLLGTKEPRPGLFQVWYMPSRMADPTMVAKMESLQAAIQASETDWEQIKQYTETLADFLGSILYSWNRSDPLNRATLISEAGPFIMSEILLALVEDRGEKKEPGNSSPAISLTTRQKRTTGKRP